MEFTFDQLVGAERTRQDQKWDEQNHSPIVWMNILGEEFGELAKAVNTITFAELPFNHSVLEDERESLQRELIQVAAVCKVMWECGKRNGWL